MQAELIEKRSQSSTTIGGISAKIPKSPHGKAIVVDTNQCLYDSALFEDDGEYLLDCKKHGELSLKLPCYLQDGISHDSMRSIREGPKLPYQKRLSPRSF